MQISKIPLVKIDPLRIVNCAPLIKSKIVCIFKHIPTWIGGKNVSKIFARMTKKKEIKKKKKAGGFLEKKRDLDPRRYFALRLFQAADP